MQFFGLDWTWQSNFQGKFAIFFIHGGGGPPWLFPSLAFGPLWLIPITHLYNRVTVLKSKFFSAVKKSIYGWKYRFSNFLIFWMNTYLEFICKISVCMLQWAWLYLKNEPQKCHISIIFFRIFDFFFKCSEWVPLSIGPKKSILIFPTLSLFYRVHLICVNN